MKSKKNGIKRILVLALAMMMLLISGVSLTEDSETAAEAERIAAEEEAARIAAEEEAARIAEEEAAQKAAEEEAARIAAEEEAAQKAAEEEAARIAAEEEAAQKAAEEEAARIAAEEEAAKKAAEEEDRRAAEEEARLAAEEAAAQKAAEEEAARIAAEEAARIASEEEAARQAEAAAAAAENEIVTEMEYMALTFSAEARVYQKSKGMLCYGDFIKLEAQVVSATQPYTVIWESLDPFAPLDQQAVAVEQKNRESPVQQALPVHIHLLSAADLPVVQVDQDQFVPGIHSDASFPPALTGKTSSL